MTSAIVASIHCCARSFTSRAVSPFGSIGGPITTRISPGFLMMLRRFQK